MTCGAAQRAGGARAGFAARTTLSSDRDHDETVHGGAV
jgi:hypothetical protein